MKPLLFLVIVAAVALTLPVFALSPLPWQAPQITVTLGLGSRDASTGGQVTLWQEFLVLENKGAASEALAAAFGRGAKKGYFGNLTGAATVEWQAAWDISPTYPAVGPKTRAKLVFLLKFFQQNPVDALTLITPNGGETWKIGETPMVMWRTPSTLNPKFVAISLIQGPTLGILTMSGSSDDVASGAMEVSLNHIFQGDVGIPIQPGNYRIKVTLYDGAPCLGLCPPGYGSGVNVIAEDESDGIVIILPQPVSISSVNPISGPIGTQVTIIGTGFTPANNIVTFSEASYPEILGYRPQGFSRSITSSDGKTITLTIPQKTDDFFYVCNQVVCPPPPPGGLPGVAIQQESYRVFVRNSNGVSNNLGFTVTAP